MSWLLGFVLANSKAVSSVITLLTVGLLMACRPRGGETLEDVFQMDVQHVLWPQLATSKSAGWSRSSSTSSIYGGWEETSVQDTWIQWEDVVLQPGNYRIYCLGFSAANSGIGHVDFAGVDTGARIDQYDASTTYNKVVYGTFTVATKTRGAIRITNASKHASSSGYRFRPCQFLIVKVSAESNAGASLDDLPFVKDIPAISWASSNHSPALTNGSNYWWGSLVQIAFNQYDYVEYDVWLAEGDYALSVVHQRSGNRGIATFSLNGVDAGNIDFYGASTNSVVSTISVSVPYTGNHKLRIRCDSKSADFFYHLYISWLQFRKTAETGTIAATGTSYGVESAEFYPWFDFTTPIWDASPTLIVDSAVLHYGLIHSDGTQNRSIEWKQNLLSGSYNLVQFSRTANLYGTYHYRIDGGADLATADGFSGGLTENVKLTASDLSMVPGSFQTVMASKNVSSFGYYGALTLTRLTKAA